MVPTTKQIIATRIRSCVSSSCRNTHCSTKNTKIAFSTTSSEAPVETACDEATTPASTKTNDPKYQPAAGGAFGGGRRLSSRNTKATKNKLSLTSKALPAWNFSRGKKIIPT